MVPLLALVACGDLDATGVVTSRAEGLSEAPEPDAPLAATILSPTAGTHHYSDRPIVLAGTINDPSVEVTWSSDLAGPLATLLPDAEGAFSTSVLLSEGEHTLSLTAAEPVVVEVGPPNTAPECEITGPADGVPLAPGDLLAFSAAVSDADVPAGLLRYEWHSTLDGVFGSGAPSAEGQVFTRTELTAGRHLITLTVTDEVGATCTALDVLTVDGPPAIVITSPRDGNTTNQGAQLNCDATAADGEDAPADLSVTWESDLDGLLHLTSPDLDGRVGLSTTALSPGTHVLTVTATDTSGQSTSDGVIVYVNGAPSAPSITLVPSLPTTLEDLRVNIDVPGLDPEGWAVTHDIAWTVDEVPAGTSDTVLAEATTRGERWRVVVTADDGSMSGAPAVAEVTIRNAPPVASGASLTPASPVVTDTLVPAATTFDADGDEVTLTWTWVVNGSPVTTPSLRRGDRVFADGVPHDGIEVGAGVATPTVIVANSPPERLVVTLSPEEPIAGEEDLACAGTAHDADGDVLTWTYFWFVDGAAWTGTPTADDIAAGDVWRCDAVASDGIDTASASAEVTVIAASRAMVCAADDRAAGADTPAGDATLEAWIRTVADGIVVSAGGRSLAVEGGFAVAGALVGPTVADDAWHHLAVVHRGDKARLYVDGALADSGEASLDGSGLTLCDGFAGTVDDVRVWDYALSSKVIGSTLSTAPAGLVAWFPLDDAFTGAGATLINEGTGGATYDLVTEGSGATPYAITR